MTDEVRLTTTPIETVDEALRLWQEAIDAAREEDEEADEPSVEVANMLCVAGEALRRAVLNLQRDLTAEQSWAEMAESALRELYEAREERRVVRKDPKNNPIYCGPEDPPRPSRKRIQSGSRCAVALKRAIRMGKNAATRAILDRVTP